jgi:uncharacterized protein Yka (UPF0111/DUF47 family)
LTQVPNAPRSSIVELSAIALKTCEQAHEAVARLEGGLEAILTGPIDGPGKPACSTTGTTLGDALAQIIDRVQTIGACIENLHARCAL